MVLARPRINSQNSNQRSVQLQSVHHHREQNRAQNRHRKNSSIFLFFIFIFCFHFHTIISHSHSHSLHKVRSFPEITVLFAPSRLSIQAPNETINALFDCLFSSYFCVCAYFHHISSPLLILSSSDAADGVVWCGSKYLETRGLQAYLCYSFVRCFSSVQTFHELISLPFLAEETYRDIHLSTDTPHQMAIELFQISLMRCWLSILLRMVSGRCRCR